MKALGTFYPNKVLKAFFF